MNKIVISGTLLIIIIMIGIPTFINVRNDHENKLIKASEQRILEAAYKCYLEKKCTTNYVTLQDLYDMKYLEVQTNPVTKKYYNSDSKIKKEDNKIILELS